MASERYLLRVCNRLGALPPAVMCVFFFMLQAAVLDYYLVNHLGNAHLTWLGADAVFTVLLILCILVARWGLASQTQETHATIFGIGWITWFAYSVFLGAKVIVIVVKFSQQLDEHGPGFFGPNTLKTAIALASIVFLLLLLTQHDAPLGSERRKYIEELTGTVVFDLLDTVDIMEVCFDGDDSFDVWQGLGECVMTVAVMNLLIPTIPLFTLGKTHFGLKKLKRRYVYLHRLLLVLIVNVPNLLLRMVMWHRFSVGISPFTLKNLIVIALTLYEFYQYQRELAEEAEEDQSGTDMHDIGNGSIGDGSMKKWSPHNTPEHSIASSTSSRGSNKRLHEGMAIESRIYF